MAWTTLLWGKSLYFMLYAVVYSSCLQSTVSTTSGAADSSINSSTVLYLLTLLPYPDLVGGLQPSWSAGANVVPAVELAVELINNETAILADYKLELTHDDSGCEIVSRTAVSFARGVVASRHEKPPVGIIGPGCSLSALRTSPLIGRKDVALIAIHLAGSQLLSDREKYPYSFGTLGSTYETYVRTVFGLMRENDWRRIAVLFDEARVAFSSAFQALERNIEEEVPGSEIGFSSAIYTTNIPLRPIRDSLIRVITIITGPEFARRIMCLAYHEDMLFPAFQWVLFGREFAEFERDIEFYYDGRSYSCSAEIMVSTVLRGNLFVNYRVTHSNRNASTISGLSYDDYLQLYQERIDRYNEDRSNPYVNITVDIYATIAFDGVWALALALNNSGLDLRDYQYGESNMTDVIREQLYRLDFEGVSGSINFDRSTGFVTRLATVFQVFNAREVLIAQSDAGILNKFEPAQFIPDAFEIVPITVKVPVATIFAVITLTLLCLTVVVHVLTFMYQNYHSLKATSPKLNNLIYIGCYMLVCTTLLYEIYNAIPQLSDQEASNICHAVWAWFLPISCTLIFGTTAARTWRLYQIFTHYLDPQPVSNAVLSAFVAVLLMLDVVIGTVWTAVDPIHVEVTRRSTSDSGYTTVLQRVCTGGNYYFVWIGIILGYKALLLMGMTILSLLTRNIRIKDFETKTLRVLVYLLGLVFSLGGLLHWILLFQAVDIHFYYVLLSVLLNVVIFLYFILVFLPPLIPLLKSKKLMCNV